jgi:toxin CcdB
LARFDVYVDPLNSNQYLLDVQSNLLSGMETRVVVPLVSAELFSVSAQRLNPVFTIQQTEFVMVTQFLSGVRIELLKSPITNLIDYADSITAALDMLFQGF